MGFIYALTDPLTDDIWYVGQTRQSLEARFRDHRKPPTTRDKSHRANYLRKLRRLNLLDLMTIQLVQEVPDEFLNTAEIYWIAYYKAVGAPLKNSHYGGIGGKQSDEANAKTADALRGRAKSAEHRAKLSAARTGTKASPETVEKLREATTLRYQDPLERKKTGDRSRGQTKSEETKAQIKATNHQTWSSEELRVKHSEIMRRVWADRKQREVS